MIKKLIELQQEIYNYHNSKEFPYNNYYSPRISFFQIGDLFEINYYGEGFDDNPLIPATDFEPEEMNFGFCALLDFICKNANKVVQLNFIGPDAGANGTRSWNFERLINSTSNFINLESFSVALTDAGDHNQSVIGEFDQEDGMIAKLVKKMPNLKELILPSAPDITFFEIPDLKIENLAIQAGYDHQGFIQNLAESTDLKHLKSLDYTEPFDHFGDLNEEEFTPYEAFEKLFQSNIFSFEHFHFKLRENRFSSEQLTALQEIRRVQFFHIKTIAGKYIRI